MIAQIIFGFLIVLLGFILFKKYPLDLDAKKITIAAFFVIIASILNMLSLMVPLMGFPALKLGFGLLPLIIAGASVFNPSMAFIVGLSYDLIGLIVKPTDFPFLGFTFANIMAAVLPSLLVIILNKVNLSIRKLETLIYSFLVVTYLFVTWYMLTTNSIRIDSNEVVVNSTLILSVLLVTLGLSVAMITIIKLMSKKYIDDKKEDVLKWTTIIIVTEVIVTFLLTSLNLYVMYEIPFFISLATRVIKGFIMIPLFTIVGYLISQMTKKALKM